MIRQVCASVPQSVVRFNADVEPTLFIFLTSNELIKRKSVSRVFFKACSINEQLKEILG